MLIEEKSNCEQITQNLIDEIKGVNMYIDHQNGSKNNASYLHSKINLKQKKSNLRNLSCFKSFKQIGEFRANLIFLREQRIVDVVGDWFEELEQCVSNSFISIEQAKEYAAMSKDEQFLFDRTSTMLK